MQTLLELIDERPLENVLGVETFRPSRVVYICPEGSSDRHTRRHLNAYFRHRGVEAELVFLTVSMYDSEAVLRVLREAVAKYPDCALDITGGTDDVLFAAGRLCAETPIPVFTYSRKKNCFYGIMNAPFAEPLPCEVVYSVEDCFLMAGGSMRQGRVDNAVLCQYQADFEPFFRLYLRHRRNWTRIVNYIQRVSPAAADGSYSLEIRGSYTVKGERGSIIAAPEEALYDLEDIGFLRQVQIRPGEGVSFQFRDRQIRAWLRDVGSVLELYVYKTCLDTGLFDDVRTSAIVDWEPDSRTNAVSNELDVMATRGVTPVFISCKACDVKTEALNELAVLRDRFGGQIARAAIVTAEKGGAPMRNRAGELNIQVIDLDDLQNGRLESRLRRLIEAGN